MTATPAVLDLDAARKERAEARAAKNEGMGKALPVWFGGHQIAELGPEFPLSVLEPLTELDVDLAFIIKRVVQAMQSQDRDQALETANLLADLIVVNPNLPAGLLAAGKEITRRVLGGDEAYTAFAGQDPSLWDIRALVTGILNWYGLSLGEFLPPSTSPEGDGGETSNPTSSATATGSTRGASGKSRAKRASSGRAAS